MKQKPSHRHKVNAKKLTRNEEDEVKVYFSDDALLSLRGVEKHEPEWETVFGAMRKSNTTKSRTIFFVHIFVCTLFGVFLSFDI